MGSFATWSLAPRGPSCGWGRKNTCVKSPHLFNLVGVGGWVFQIAPGWDDTHSRLLPLLSPKGILGPARKPQNTSFSFSTKLHLEKWILACAGLNCQFVFNLCWKSPRRKLPLPTLNNPLGFSWCFTASHERPRERRIHQLHLGAPRPSGRLPDLVPGRQRQRHLRRPPRQSPPLCPHPQPPGLLQRELPRRAGLPASNATGCKTERGRSLH